jgi:acid phosphatase
MMTFSRLLALLVLAAIAVGCGSGSGSGGTPPPISSHVFLLVEENHSFSDVISNSSMPYLNSVASQGAVATQYYADAHPSLPNYFVLTTGRLEQMNNDFAGTIADDNIVRELVKAGKTWHSYAESLPSVGYVGADVSPYLRHHNPFTFFTDVIGTAQANNIVPFSQFASDLAANTLPDFSFIVPNVMDDAHDGSLTAADQWLSTNIDPLIKSSTFQSGGLLIIVFDEGEISDNAHGGGHVPFILVGPQVKSGYQSSSFFQHESTLRLVLSTLGITSFPGNSQSARQMGEFFKTQGSP